MEYPQPGWYRIIFVASSLVVAGCQPGLDAPGNEKTRVKPEKAATSRTTDFLSTARRMLQAGDAEAAAEAAYKALLQDPNNAVAKLIAGQAESAQGNHQTAVELAGSVDIDSRWGKQAVEIRYRALLEMDRPREAADLMLSSLETVPNAVSWRREAWRLLNRLGRRKEASLQADVLCRTGEANPQELLSLLRRNDSFPFVLKKSEDPKRYFEPGLGRAKWYFTRREYQRALKELSVQRQEGFESPEACALFGRSLAEAQRVEEISDWHAQCPSGVQEHSDYWAALGTYFFARHDYEASVRALMEALVRNPTDTFCAHRLAKAFDALGRTDDGEQFRHRAVLIGQVEQASERLSLAPGPLRKTDGLPSKLLELGRPFEALQWISVMLPESAVEARTQIYRQRSDLVQGGKAMGLPAEMALLGMDPREFSLDAALSQPSRSAAPVDSMPKKDADPLAAARLVNVAGQVGLEFQWYQDVEINLASIPIHEIMGGGIAVIDYDLDGWPDVYLAQGSGDPPTDACTRSNVLFRNRSAKFEVVTRLSSAEDFHYSTGLAAGDVNQDGFPDLYLGSIGSNRVLINNGDGTFRDATESLGDVKERFTSSLAIADINGDALPDLFEAVYLELPGGLRLPEVGSDGREIQPTPNSFYAQSDRWFENLGDGRFQSHQIGEEIAAAGSSLGVIVTDFDADGANEVFVSNDGRPNHYLVPLGDNQFANAADAKGLASGFGGDANACMGIATGDFNRDGNFDLHVSNFRKESANHYLQLGEGGFTDFAPRYGIDKLTVPYVGFGTKAIDIDRNGWLDLIVTNGHVFDQRHLGEEFQMPPQVLINRGNRFDELSVNDDSEYWDGRYLGRSMAMLDFDRDGEIDFLVGHLDHPLALLQNRTRSAGRWIQFEFVGTASERDAIGTRVVLTIGDQQLAGWVTAGDGYLGSDEPLIDFGIGGDRSIDRADIHWPSGTHQTIQQLEAGHRYLVIEGDDDETVYQRPDRVGA